MAGEPDTQENGLPQPTEQVHMPEPSYLPVVTAFGITLMLVGVTLTCTITVIAAIFFLAAAAPWVRETRSDIGELLTSRRVRPSRAALAAALACAAAGLLAPSGALAQHASSGCSKAPGAY